MTDSTIGLPTDGTGKKVDTEQLAVGGVTVQRERMQIAGAADVEIVKVMNSAPAGTEYAQVVRPIPSGTQSVAETRPATPTLTNVVASAASVNLLASNTSRRMATFFNDSAANCYLKFGATASTVSFTVKIAPFGYFELPFPVYTGVIDGIWDSATGNMRVTETA